MHGLAQHCALEPLAGIPSVLHVHPSPSPARSTPIAAAIVVVLCLSWGFNQVAAKLAIHDIPPLIQGDHPLRRSRR